MVVTFIVGLLCLIIGMVMGFLWYGRLKENNKGQNI